MIQIPPKPLAVDEFRRRVVSVRLGIPRVDAQGRRFTAVYGLRREEGDAMLAFLTDDNIGGPNGVMAGGWKCHFVLEGVFNDGTPFSIHLTEDACMWRSPGYTLGDQIVRPGLLELIERYV